MKKVVIFFLILIIWYENALAQDADNNIVIEHSVDEYRFIKGNKDNPVQIKQNLETIYRCNNFRTSIPIVEFYNDQVKINDADIRVNGDKVRGFTPAYDYHNIDGIFYSDARVCHFGLPLEKKGTVSKVMFDKTILDPRYFTNIFFSEPYFIEKKEVIIVVPKWMKIAIKEYNFDGYSITKSISSKPGEDVYSYVIQNAPLFRQETYAPGPTHTAPHLLIMNKYAEPEGSRITYFNTLTDQYNWYHQLIKQTGNETGPVKSKVEEIIKGITGDREKVNAIYQWVQDNIRYIAYEDGIAGFKPDKAQDVLRKKYGDCKGMGNLMAELLKAAGLDGRICWLGTNHIAYDYSTPSLGVDNHVICAWIYKNKTYFLDATEKYIGFEETAERIQGRQVLIEDGDKYILQRVPVADQLQNTMSEKRVLVVNGNDLEGKITQIWKGESKEWLFSQLHDIKKERQEEVLKHFLAGGKNNYQISNLQVSDLNDYSRELRIEYNLIFKDAITSFGKEIYIDIDDRKDFSKRNLDTAKRKLPYLFPYKEHILFEVELQLPKDAKPGSLPPSFQIDEPGYSMKGSFVVDKTKIIYKREIMLKNAWLSKQDFAKWNNNISKLNDFYNSQLVVTK